MVYNKFVEVGRVISINYGADINKLAVITDIIDHNRVIVDGPATEVKRQVISIRRINLTKFTIALPRGARTATVSKCWTASGVADKWAATGTAKKLAQLKVRRNLTDFDRFKVMVAQKKKSRIVKA